MGKFSMDSFTYFNDIKEKKYLDHIRQELGLKPLQEENKNCICCGKTFISRGVGNRMCLGCRRYRRDE